jgi:hypothetical protein
VDNSGNPPMVVVCKHALAPMVTKGEGTGSPLPEGEGTG